MISPKVIFQFVFIAALGVFFDLASQNKQIDSLLNLLKVEKRDSVRLLLLNDLSDASDDPDVFVKYNEEIITLSKKNLQKAKGAQRDFFLLRNAAGLINIGYALAAQNKYDKAIKNYLQANKLLEQIKQSSEDSKLTHAYLCNNLSTVYRDIGKGAEARSFIRKAVTIFETIDDPEGLAMAYSNLAGNYSISGAMDSAMVFYNKSIELYKKNNNNDGVATVYNNIGDHYDKKGNTKKAIEHYTNAYEAIRKGKNKNSLAYIQQNLGITYGQTGNIDIGLKYLFGALNLFTELKDKKGQYYALSNIGGIYYRDKDYKNAEKYFIESASAATEIDYPGGISTSYYRLGNIETQKGNYSGAFSYFTRAIELCKKHDKHRTLADTYNSIAELFKKRKMTDSAEYFYNAALATSESIKHNIGVSTALVSLSELYFNKGNVKHAKDLAEKGFVITEELGNIVEQKNAAEMLYKIYKQIGNTGKALEMHEYFTKLEDSLKSEEAQKAIIRSQLHKEYLTLREKDSLSNIQKESAHEKKLTEKDAQITTAGKLKTGLLLLLLASLIAAMIIYLRYLKKSKLHDQVKEQNALLEAKNKEKELLMHEIHHRVKNNLQIVSSLLKLPQKQITDVKAIEVMDDSRHRIHSVSLIHKLLYENTNVTNIDAKEYINELCNAILNGFANEKNSIKLNLNIASIKIDVDQFVPLALILNELLLNSIKYAFENVSSPEVSIDLKKDDRTIKISFSDNGLVDSTAQIKSKSSFGTKMIHSLTGQLNGLIDVYFKNGTNISIKFDAV